MCVSYSQDIRKFFGPTGGSKKPASEAKLQAPAKSKKSSESQLKNAKKGASSRSVTSLKNKPSKPLELEDDRDVEIISDSDEEATGKKGSKKGSGRGHASPAKSKKAVDASAKNTDQPAIKPKQAGSKGPDTNGKGKVVKILKSDSDSESEMVGIRSRRKGRNKKHVIDSDSAVEEDESPLKQKKASIEEDDKKKKASIEEDESPFKKKKALRSRRRSPENGDSDEEVMKSKEKKPRKASRRNVMVGDSVLRRLFFF